MKKFSWYTTEETTFDCVGQKFYRVCVDGEPIIGFYPYYKPNRKGGHRHLRNFVFCKTCHKFVRIPIRKLPRFPKHEEHELSMTTDFANFYLVE